MHPLFAWPLVDWRFAHASVPPTSLQARRSGFVAMKLCIRTESCRAPLLRLIDTPSPWPLIHSSPSPSSPPASPPASRHPASLPRLACFSRSGCPHPAHASTASTPSCLAKINSFVRRFCAGDAPPRFLCLPCAPRSRRAVLPFVWNRLPWSPSTWRVPGRTREALLRLDKGISWAETSSLGAWARLTLPLLRPLLARRSWCVPCFRAKLLPSGEEFAQGTPRVASSACHARPARGVRCFLSSGFDCHGVLGPGECSAQARRSLFDVGQGHLMGGDFETWRLGAWAAAHETIPKSCFGISV